MKNKYSDIRFAWRSLYSKEEFVTRFKPFFNKGKLNFSPEIVEYIEYGGGKNAFVMDYLLCSNSPLVTHYFIETKELYDFLASSEIKELSYAHMQAKKWGYPRIDKMVANVRMRQIVLHHQDTTLPSIKVVYSLLNEYTSAEQFYIYVEDGDTYAGFRELEAPKGYLISDLNNPSPNHLYTFARVAMNFLLYEACFPDKIVNGPPECLANPNHYRRFNNKTLKVASEIVDRDGPTPHFRSGYFRFLKDERYTHKRFQMVFVRSTFVHGKAKTVEE